MITPQSIRDLLKLYTASSELEIRLGFFSKGRFNSRFGTYAYNIMVKQLMENPNMTISKREESVVRYTGGYRSVDGLLSQKERVRLLDDNETVRIALSNEYDVRRPPPNLKKTGSFVRTRVSFTDTKNGVRFDLSTGQNGYKDMEVEFVTKPTSDLVMQVYSYIKNEYGKLMMYQSIADNMNIMMVGKSTGYLRTVGKKPRDILERDIYTINKYKVLVKLDGEGYSMFFTNIGTFLLNPSNFIEYRPPVPGLEGTLIQGELLDNTFYAYDIYRYKGESYQDNPYEDRWYLMQKISCVYARNFFEVPILHEYGEHEDIVKNLHDFPKNDGLIFIPKEPGLEFLKWKPQELLTVDLIVREFPRMENIPYAEYIDDKNLHTAYCYSDDGVLEYLGNMKYTPELIHKLTGRRKLEEFMVMECRYDSSDNVYIPIRWRTDKTAPNHRKTVDSTLDNINTYLSQRIENLFSTFKPSIVCGPFTDDDDAPAIQASCEMFKTTRSFRTFDGMPKNVLIDYMLEVEEHNHKNKFKPENKDLMTGLEDYLKTALQL